KAGTVEFQTDVVLTHMDDFRRHFKIAGSAELNIERLAGLQRDVFWFFQAQPTERKVQCTGAQALVSAIDCHRNPDPSSEVSPIFSMRGFHRQTGQARR